MYEPPLLDFYDNAILNNGDPRELHGARSAGTSAGRAGVSRRAWRTCPPGFVLPRQSINAVDPDFRTQSAWLSNVQVERALSNDMAVSVGYVNSIGRNLPVLMDINLIPTGQTLADGRPIYSTAVSAATRVDPTFNHVNMFKSIAESTYNAFTATLTKRMTHGWQAQATYTLARGVDNAPLTGTYVVGSGDDRVSDPIEPGSRQGRDAVQPDAHVLAVSTVIAPHGDRTRHQARRSSTTTSSGIILQANSGLPFNIRSNRRSEPGRREQRSADRASIATPGGSDGVVYLDLRYSRFVPLRDSVQRGAVLRGQEPLQHRRTSPA